jgi:hypothetical protein
VNYKRLELSSEIMGLITDAIGRAKEKIMDAEQRNKYADEWDQVMTKCHGVALGNLDAIEMMLKHAIVIPDFPEDVEEEVYG